MGLLKELQRMVVFRRNSNGCVQATEQPCFVASKAESPASTADPMSEEGEKATAGSQDMLRCAAVALEADKDDGPIQRSPSTSSTASVEILEAPPREITPQDSQKSEEDERELQQEEGATLSFDAPLEQVYAGIGKVFGPMITTSLRSTKWDKRTQALREIASVLRGHDLCRISAPGSTGALGVGLRQRDPVRCWRLSCQLLCHIVRDKVMPVRLAAHELLQDTFVAAEGGTVAQDEVRRAGEVLVESVIDRLGDSNVRLHESARRCVLFLAEHPGALGLTAVLARLRARLEKPVAGKAGGKEAGKLYFGVLDTANAILGRFPSRKDSTDEASWSLEEISPLLAAGLSDDISGQRVRAAAAALAVTVYRVYGIEAMTPLLESLRPAKQAFLRQKFEEAERAGEPGEEAPGLGAGSLRRGGSFNDLMAANTPMKLPPGYTLPPLSCSPGPGLDLDDEETLMDGILEEAGMVFNGLALVNEAGHEAEGSASQFGIEQSDEQRLLEEELLNMGIDLETLDEQQALLSSLKSDKGGRGRNGLGVEVF